MKTILLTFIKNLSKSFVLSFLLFGFLVQGQTTVNSLQALKPYLNDNNANVKLAPGVYTVTADDVDNGLYNNPTTIGTANAQSLFLFEGNNSTYDFTDVTINVETAVLRAYGNIDFYELHIVGSNNILKNLTMVDVGSVNDAPRKRTTNVVMDGRKNRIEGFRLTVKGSNPYGYGDIFGKGGATVIRHQKHSGILVRGESNHLKNTTLIHRAYGHGIYMQASNKALIEGCYVEGELRTTDEVLAERGTAAADVNFMTVWGYRLHPGWTFSKQEDGIRDYSGGATVIDGEIFERGASNTTVIDCTVKYMRSGVTIGLGAGSQRVENVTVLGCESGFWTRDNADVINCRGDASVGPLYSEDREKRNVTIDLTLLDNDVSKYGNTPSLYLAGRNHNITLKDGTTSFNSEIEILVGGRRLGHRWLAGSGEEPPNYAAEDFTFVNETLYPIVIGSNSSDNNVTSCGPVTDNGSNNDVEITNTCDDGPNQCVVNPAYIEAECYSTQSGVQSEPCSEGGLNIGFINNEDWMFYRGVDLTNTKSINVRVASNFVGGTIEIRLGSRTGTVIGELPVSNTGGNQEWKTINANIESVQGIQDVYLVFKGGDGYLFNINYFGFSEATLSTDDNKKLSVTTFPNPVINTLNIQNGEALNIEVYNSLGQLQFKNEVLNNDYKVDMSSYSSGLYFLKTFNGKTVTIQKIVKK